MIFFIIGVVAALFALAVLLLAKEYKNSAIIPAVVAVVMIGISCVSYVLLAIRASLRHLAKSRTAQRTQVLCSNSPGSPS